MDILKSQKQEKSSNNFFKIPSRKGQGLSLTVIIVAALALVVLVVLVLIFTGRMSVFSEGLGQEGAAELTKYKITYSDCHPTSSQENVFLNEMGQAANDKDNQQEMETDAKDDFEELIDDCRSSGIDENACESDGCDWK